MLGNPPLTNTATYPLQSYFPPLLLLPSPCNPLPTRTPFSNLNPPLTSTAT